MTFTWVTMAPSHASIVEYGLRESPILSARTFGTMKLFKDFCGDEHRKIYVHRVKLENLTPGESYGKMNICLLCFISDVPIANDN